MTPGSGPRFTTWHLLKSYLPDLARVGGLKRSSGVVFGFSINCKSGPSKINIIVTQTLYLKTPKRVLLGAKGLHWHKRFETLPLKEVVVSICQEL